MDSDLVLRVSIVVLLIIAFTFSIVATFMIPKKLDKCIQQPNPTAPKTPNIADVYAIAANQYYLFTKNELTLISMMAAFGVIASVLCFLVYLNNFRVLSIVVAIGVVVVSSVTLSTIVSLSNDPNPDIAAQYDPNSGITLKLLYVAMGMAILASIITFYYYGRNFVKDMKSFV